MRYFVLTFLIYLFTLNESVENGSTDKLLVPFESLKPLKNSIDIDKFAEHSKNKIKLIGYFDENFSELDFYIENLDKIFDEINDGFNYSLIIIVSEGNPAIESLRDKNIIKFGPPLFLDEGNFFSITNGILLNHGDYIFLADHDNNVAIKSKELSDIFKENLLKFANNQPKFKDSMLKTPIEKEFR